MAEYDNNNRGSLFMPKSESAPCDLSGKATIDGCDYYIDYYRGAGRVRGVAVFKDTTDHDRVFAVPLRASDKGKCVMYGKFTLFGSEYTVNIFKNEPKNERSPVLQLSFMEKEGEAAPKTTVHLTPAVTSYDDIPF